MILISAALASPDPSIGGFVGAHLAGKEHELYDVPGIQHQTLGPTIPFGVRAGLKLAGPLHAEGEAMFGPAPAVKGAIYGFRAQLTVHTIKIANKVTPLVTVGGGNLGIVSGRVGNDVDLAAHFGPGMEIDLGSNVHFRTDLRWMLSGRKGLAPTPGSHFEVLVGALWRMGVRDRDNDGILDPDDACPTEKEIFNGYMDIEGCPDALADLVVTAKDAEGTILSELEIFDADEALGKTDVTGGLGVNDLMPGRTLALHADTPELEPAKATLELREGRNSADLVLGWAAGTLIITAFNAEGDPVDATVRAIGVTNREWRLGEDGEAQEVLKPGEWRLLVDAEGFETVKKTLRLPPVSGARTRLDAVLQREVVKVEKEKIKILEKIQFEYDSHVVKAGSVRVVDAVAKALTDNPEIEKVEVGGHASEEGTARYNLELSQSRVDEVVRLLVARGVGADRLVAKGYGETVPLETGDSEEARAKNRRVEFNILEREDAP